MKWLKSLPFSIKVLLGACLGIVLGILFKKETILLDLKNEHLGQLGMLVIKMLRMLATPLVFFAILESFTKISFTLKQGLKFLSICLVNISVAMIIGLTLMNVFRPGEMWQGKMNMMKEAMHSAHFQAKKVEDPEAPEVSLGILSNVSYYIPSGFLRPFFYNNIISVVILAILCGLALRKLKKKRQQPLILEKMIEECFEWFVLMLEAVILLIPFAVCGVVAQVVGSAGIEVFSFLWIYLLFILIGFFLHAGLYYPFMAYVFGKKSPAVYLGQGSDAILSGFSMNSSLAAVPLTLQCLTQKMNVSHSNARLSSLIGTNFNNDGITLYEAMTAIFLAQALGLPLTLSQQGMIVLSSIMAGAGIAGIPEAGLIVLPLVLSTAGIPAPLILSSIPLILPVDWILARCRSGVNVMSDMLVAILLDAWEKKHHKEGDNH